MRFPRTCRCRSPRRQAVVYRPRNYLLTRNEAAFFRVLQSLLASHYQLSCKVRLADIVTCDDAAWQHGHANRISQKHIDFVVNCPETSRILAAIELDDSSHDRPDRRERDAFIDRLFWQMRLRLIRIPARWNYDRDLIAQRLAGAGLLVPELRQSQRGWSSTCRSANKKSYRRSFGVAQSPKARSVGRVPF